jgi:hypothetical protein
MFLLPSNNLIRGILQKPMAISHEISSEIAAAILARRNGSPHELRELQEMLLQVHSTLEDLQLHAKDHTAPEESGPTIRSKAAGKLP